MVDHDPVQLATTVVLFFYVTLTVDTFIWLDHLVGFFLFYATLTLKALIRLDQLVIVVGVV